MHSTSEQNYALGVTGIATLQVIRVLQSRKTQEVFLHSWIVWRAKTSHRIPSIHIQLAYLTSKTFRSNSSTYPGVAEKPLVPQPGLLPSVISLRTPGLRYRAGLMNPTGPLPWAIRSSMIRVTIEAKIGAPRNSSQQTFS